MRLRTLLVVVLAAGCGAAHETSGVVPWLDHPLALYRVPPPRTISYPTSAPACHASQLRATQGRGGAAAGTYYERVVFTNVGTTTCLLRGYPTISAVGPSGVRQQLRSQMHDHGVDALVPADIPPGKHVLLDLRSSDQCYPAAHYRRPVFRFPHVGSIAAGDRFGLLVFCDLAWSNVGLPLREVSVSTIPGTPSTLELKLRVPAMVRAGSTLRYVATLHNPTATKVVLKPCPGYTQGLYASGLVVRGSFELNCAAARSIPAGGRVRFEMRLAVPERAKAWFAKLGWSLDTPTGPFTGAAIRIGADSTS